MWCMKGFGRIRELLFSLRLWFVVGMGVKRWLVVLGIAAAIIGIGITYLLLGVANSTFLPSWLRSALTLSFIPFTWMRILVSFVVGGLLILVATARLGANLVAPFREPDSDIAESIYRHQQSGRGPHVVAIGGGTGMPGLLRGLTSYTRNITAIVTVADDGGSSGRLRRELGLLPPGDFRNNIAALARDEALMTQLMQYRFGAVIGSDEPSQLHGHAFGNLVLAALTGITGSFDEALLAMDKVLAMRGRVMPSTLAEVTLIGDVQTSEGRKRVVGESALPKAGGTIERVYLEPEGVRAYPPALKAILQADLIVMGPGSLYTSVLPNLIVSDLAQALRHSKAPKVYVCNVARQPGETDGYDVAEHVAAIVAHTHADCVDYVIANDNLSISPKTGGGETIFVKPNGGDSAELITADLLDEQRPWRHDSKKVAAVVMKLLQDE